MRKAFLIILILINFSEAKAQTGWFEQQTGTDITLRSIFMLNNSTGFAAGGDVLIDNAVDRGIILNTTNGGANWSSRVDANFDKILYSITFPNNQTGYAVGRDGSTYAIFKSTNGGDNWFQQEPPSTSISPPLYSVYFFDAETGFTTGAGGKVFKTTNGGINWTVNSFPNNSTLYSITFTGSEGFIASDNAVYKSTDSGNSWNTTLSSTGIAFQSVFFSDQNTGYTVGGSKIFKTTNAGTNWTSIELSGNSFFSIHFPSMNIGYCSGLNRAIYKTTDAGTSWEMQTQGGGVPLYSIFFSDDTTGYAAGNVGYMLRTTTGGTVGISIISGEIPGKYYLHQNYPNPFNPETVINYNIPLRAHVILSIYDVTGRLLVQAVNKIQAAGSYRYNFDGTGLPGGVYFIKMIAGEYTAVRKMILLK